MQANELCESSRDDLNRYIEEENEKRRAEVRNRKVIAVTLVLALPSLVVALLSVPQFNSAVFNTESQNGLERPAIEGDSPVCESERVVLSYRKVGRTREILSEHGGTTLQA